MEQPTKSRVRRQHSPEFKRQVVDECRQPGASVAGVALAHGVNANLVRRWLRERSLPASPRPAVPPAELGFVPVRLEPASPLPAPDIRLELRRGSTTVAITWPVSAAEACGAWLREWLR